MGAYHHLEELHAGPLDGLRLLRTTIPSFTPGGSVLSQYPHAAGCRYERRSDGLLWYQESRCWDT